MKSEICVCDLGLLQRCVDGKKIIGLLQWCIDGKKKYLCESVLVTLDGLWINTPELRSDGIGGYSE